MGRIFGIFFSPGETFAQIAKSPTFLLPMLVVMAFTLATSQVVVRRIGLENLVQQQIQKSPRAEQMSKAQMDAAVEMGVRIGKVTTWLNPIFVAIGIAIIAAVLLMMANFIFGGTATYKQMMAVTSHAWVPPAVIGGILGMAVVFMKDPSDIDVENLLVTNLGVIISAETSKFLHRMAVSMDLLSFWQIYLLATGISACSNQVTFGKGLTAVVIPWALYVLVVSGFASFR
jgi:hypothetical protein